MKVQSIAMDQTLRPLFWLALLLLTGCMQNRIANPANVPTRPASASNAPAAANAAAAAPAPDLPSNPAPDLPNNPAPAPEPINPQLPTIFIASDSTAARGSGESQRGWGVPFADYF